MIFQWVDNPTLKQTEQLLNLIYDLGMVQIRHLEAVTGWSYQKTKKQIYLFRKELKKRGEDEKKWLRTVHQKKWNDQIVYYLGPRAMYHVNQMRQQHMGTTRGLSPYQQSHYMGINNILLGAIEFFGRAELEWYTEFELADLLTLQLGNVERSKILRPDAKLRIKNEHEFFVEYDNATVGPRKLEQKFMRYIDFTSNTGYQTPVLWVTVTEQRKQYLERNWKTSMGSYDSDIVPESYFFVAGEELRLYEKF
ncbi:hypothetical protein J6TS7_20700 [Paenibacillus dendritiformis]|uniref:replication-relaxation family protein n=1 Tax=Paenibacillus TaxID=44249 RepID=UPI001B0FAEEA|nr:replication-relaxation family protein [Paenibacillus dendritiformis]GIO78460.1 hypothetical protein J6TS7_20700 [Paenibacillus dendritiformis]